MMRPFSVRIRLLDAIGNKLAETSVACQALHPGSACASAWVVMRDDIKRSPKPPKAHAVQFLVVVSKGAKK